FLIGRKRHWSIPVPAQLLLIVGLGLNIAPFVSVTIYPTDITTLVFSIDIIGIARIGEGKESVAIPHVFPSRVSDAPRILGIANPAAVVLQSAVDVIRIVVIDTDVIKLRDGQVIAFPPFASAVVGIPHSAVIAGKDRLRIGWINPEAMDVAM